MIKDLFAKRFVTDYDLKKADVIKYPARYQW